MNRSVVRRCALAGGLALAATFVAGVTPAYAKDTTAPGPVTGVSIYGKSGASSASLTVSFTKPTASDLKGVYVWRNTSRTLTGATPIAKYTTATSVTESVGRGALYWYYLRAYDKSGNYSSGVWIPVRTAASSSSNALSGFVTDAKGVPLDGIDVSLTRGKNYAIETSTASSGVWETSELPYAARGWGACFRTFGHTQGGLSKTGYLPECYDNASYDDPKAAKRLPVNTGGEFRSVVTSLAAGGALSSKVVGPAGTPGASGLAGVGISVFDNDGDFAGSYYTDESGSWQIDGLAAGTGYTIQADAVGIDLDAYPRGLVSQWYGGKFLGDYDAGDRPVTGVSTYTVTAGVLNARGTVTLTNGGTISGEVSTTGDNSTSSGSVTVFDADTGRQITSVDYDSADTYTVRGLPARDYTVCAQAYDLDDQPGSCLASDGSSLDWDGNGDTIPAGTDRVPVTVNGDTPNIDIVIHGINGLVAGTVSGQGATVFVIGLDTTVEQSFDVDAGSSYEVQVHRGTYNVCAISSGTSTGLCRTATGTIAWNGDSNAVPAGAAEITVPGDGSKTGLNFSFAAG